MMQNISLVKVNEKLFGLHDYYTKVMFFITRSDLKKIAISNLN